MIQFCPLSDIASPDSLSLGEWEALARLAAVVQDPSMIQRWMLDFDIDHPGVHGVVDRIDYIDRQLRGWVVARMYDQGLDPLDFVVIARPFYPPQELAHQHDYDVPRQWEVGLRLKRKHEANVEHKPTLAEQHGKARD